MVGSGIAEHYYDFDRARWCLDHFDDIRAAESHLLTEVRDDRAARLVAATGLAMHIDEGTRAADLLTRIDTHLHRASEPALAARLHATAALLQHGDPVARRHRPTRSRSGACGT